MSHLTSIADTEEQKEQVRTQIQQKQQVLQHITKISKAKNTLKQEAEKTSKTDILQRIKQTINSRKDEPWAVRNKCPSFVTLGSTAETLSTLYPVCSLFTERQQDVPEQDWHLLSIPFQNPKTKTTDYHKTLCCTKTMQLMANTKAQAIMDPKENIILRIMLMPLDKPDQEFWRNIFAQFLQLGSMSYEDVRKFSSKKTTEEQSSQSLEDSLLKLNI